MNMQEIRFYLQQLQHILQEYDLWQTIPPTPQAFASEQPFAIDTMAANEWLQWIFIPRIQALLESGAALPTKIAISPYIEEALKEHSALPQLLSTLVQLEKVLQQD